MACPMAAIMNYIQLYVTGTVALDMLHPAELP